MDRPYDVHPAFDADQLKPGEPQLTFDERRRYVMLVLGNWHERYREAATRLLVHGPVGD